MSRSEFDKGLGFRVGGSGDVVSWLITGMTRVIVWLIRVISILTRSPDLVSTGARRPKKLSSFQTLVFSALGALHDKALGILIRVKL